MDLSNITAAELSEIRPFGGWQVVIADPPWKFSSNSDAKPAKNARRHYKTMPLKQIKAIPVREMVAPDALLLLWATVPMMPQGLEVMKSWGFTYKSQLVWDKKRISTGYWARNRHEIVLIGRRRRFPCERPALFDDSVIEEKRREHSRKPDLLHDTINRRFPEMTKLELFGRSARDGWTVLGNQTDKFTPQPALPTTYRELRDQIMPDAVGCMGADAVAPCHGEV